MIYHRNGGTCARKGALPLGSGNFSRQSALCLIRMGGLLPQDLSHHPLAFLPFPAAALWKQRSQVLCALSPSYQYRFAARADLGQTPAYLLTKAYSPVQLTLPSK